MNVLLFTTTMILLLGSLTYARLEMYRSLSILQGEFNQYMTSSERSAINNQAITWYETSVASKKAPQPAAPPKQVKKQALARLSFVSFVDNQKKGAYSQEYPQLEELAKKLFEVLYRNQRFYQENRQKIDTELFPSLMTAVEHLPANQKISRAKDLANLKLEDPILNDLFYKMLQGTMVPGEKSDPQKVFTKEQPLLCQPEPQGEVDDESIEPGKKDEVKSPEGYYSLLDFITLQDAAKVRVYLAPKPLLLAIFEEPGLVNELIETRCDLYKKVVRETDPMPIDEATTAFQTQFSKQGRGFDETILDFTVSKVNPRNYE